MFILSENGAIRPVICVSGFSGAENQEIGGVLTALIARNFDFRIPDEESIASDDAEGDLLASLDRSLNEEGFSLSLKDGKAFIRGGSAGGLLRGMNELLDKSWGSGGNAYASDMEITDNTIGLPYRIYNCHGARSEFGLDHMIRFVKDCMLSAVRLNMNTFVLTKDWPVQVSDVVTYKYFPPLQEYVDQERSSNLIDVYKNFSAYADKLHLKFYIAFTEFGIPKAAFVKYPDWCGTRHEKGMEVQASSNPCFSHPYTLEHFKAKIREICEIIPNAAGIELWIGEKENSPFYCQCEKCRDIPASERALTLINTAYDIMKLYGPHKKLIVRTYLCAGRCYYEPEVFLPIADKLPEDIILILKGQYGDFDYLNDPHPLTGRIPRETVIEFDAGGEYRAYYFGYFSSITGYVQARMDFYREYGVTGFMFRHIDWLGEVSFSEIYALAKLCFYPSRRGCDFEFEYLSHKFGTDAAVLLCKLMKAGEVICEKDLHILGCNAFGCFGLLPDSLFRLRYNVFDHCARMKTGSMKRLMSCVDDPSEALAEKDGAQLAMTEFAEILSRLEPLLPDGIFKGLDYSLSVMQVLIAPHKILTRLLFEYLAYERTIYTEDRLKAIFSISKTLTELRVWAKQNSSVLESVSLSELRFLQGINAETREMLDNRNNFVSAEEIMTLCDGVENSFDKNWEFYKWNIIL